MTERLQSMGYLPTAPKKLEADLVHHSEDNLSLDEIQSEAKRLQDIRASLPKKKVKSKTLREKKKRKGKKNDQE